MRHRRFTFIVMTIDYCVQYLNQNEKWKRKKTEKTRFFYVVKVKITFLFTSRYELRYLLINDIMRLIFKW